MKSSQFSKNKQRQVLRWLGTILAFVLLVYLVRQQGFDEIRSAFKEISITQTFLALILIFISRFAVVCRWHVLLRSIDKVNFSQTLRITFAGLFATNFLPTTVGGDVVRLAGAVQMKINGPFAAASLIVDRLVGMLGMVCALPFGAIPLVNWFESSNSGLVFTNLVASFAWLERIRDRILLVIKKMVEAIKIWLKHPKSLLFSYLFTILHMTCLFLAITILLDDLGERLPFFLIAGLWSFVYFVTLIPVSINGYGVQELSIAFIFSEVGGISLQSGITISILLRLMMIIGSLPGSLFLPGIFAGEESSPQNPNEKVEV